MLDVALILVSSATIILCSCNAPSPISLSITNILLSNGQKRRGIPGSIGTPAQNFAFMPQNFLNDTWAYNTSDPFCFNDTTSTQCLTQRGGLYDPTASSSCHDNLSVYEAEGSASDTFREVATHIWFNNFANDVLSVGNTSLDNFPIGMPGFDYGGFFDTQANIGLGMNSTILNALKAGGHIASRVYSYWWGIDSTSSTLAMDGQLVLGGYDQAKATGPNVTGQILPWTLACPSGMYVTVTNMILGFPNGTTADMLWPSTLSACLQPDFPTVISLRGNPYFDNFENLTGTNSVNNSHGIYWWAPVYEPSAVYQGDLTIKFDNEFAVNIPNDVLVVSDQYVGPSGAVETNSSASLVLISPDNNANADNTPIIGMPFFSGAYLMVDLDASTFTLWQANATEDSKIVAIGGNCSAAPTVNSQTNGSSSNTGQFGGTGIGHNDNNPSNSTIRADSSHTSISAPAIAGIAVASAVSLSSLAGIAAVVLARRRRSRRHQSDGSVALTNVLKISNGKNHYSDETRLSSQQESAVEPMSQPINELSAAQKSPYELSSTFKPVEADGKSLTRLVEMSADQTPRLGKSFTRR